MSTPSPWQWSAYSIHVYTRKHVRVHIAMDLTPLDPIWENVSRRSFQKKNTLNPASSHYVILSSNLSKLNLTQKNMGFVWSKIDISYMLALPASLRVWCAVRAGELPLGRGKPSSSDTTCEEGQEPANINKFNLKKSEFVLKFLSAWIKEIFFKKRSYSHRIATDIRWSSLSLSLSLIRLMSVSL